MGSVAALDAFSGSIASLVSTILFYPYDVAKTRLQADPEACGGTILGALAIVVEDGPAGCITGLWLTAFKQTLASAIFNFWYSILSTVMRRVEAAWIKRSPALGFLASFLHGTIAG